MCKIILSTFNSQQNQNLLLFSFVLLYLCVTAKYSVKCCNNCYEILIKTMSIILRSSFSCIFSNVYTNFSLCMTNHHIIVFLCRWRHCQLKITNCKRAKLSAIFGVNVRGECMSMCACCDRFACMYFNCYLFQTNQNLLC